MGTIEVGKQADLIVLSENPIENIKNTRKIEMIFQKGKSFDHKSFLKSIEARNKKRQEQAAMSINPDPTNPENIENPNGRGVFLMRNLADKVSFEENGSKVILDFKTEAKAA